MNALEDYSDSHPMSRDRIAAHCAATSVSRFRFQARMAKLLVSRLVSSGRISSTKPAEGIARQPGRTMKQHVLSQWYYSLNTLRMIRFGIRQWRMPALDDIRRGMKVSAYHSREKRVKDRFFQRRYGAALAVSPQVASLRDERST
jgi:hypothetical protein